ncbi:flagellar filament capping protein FliD [Anaerobacillus sp. 1_MG-2023]|uniref:flagellar filament capping protein FliD n=1 Tax=Anaerobacillus sp. 1_MG-2023 TaxID=3062655 RepID=UPI0026E374D3|nr:flagellar filament capping protein FliD [Anaerobacillus sp. 1_MG-2023]MDO6656367.1 flagellar filament capping protein FliD [Anaerobacillus sp. 1_MG-2023]
MRISGLATGMDIDQMVKDLMTAERVPLDKLSQQKQTYEWQKDSYRELNTMMSDMRTAASSMRLQSGYNAYKSTSSSTAVKATATSASLAGSYDVTVNELAQSAKLTSGQAIMNDAGTAAKGTDKVLKSTETASFQITNSKGQTASINITASDTFKSFAEKIAGAVDDGTGESLGMRASFDNTTSRFFISSKAMGGDESFTLSGFSDTNIENRILGGAANAAQGKYGSVTFDGITVDNLKTNATTINNLKLDLVQKGTATVSVQSDTQAPFDMIKSFVEKYNEFVDKTQTLLTEKKYRDFPPLTDAQREDLTDKEIELWEEKAKSGLLQSDSTVRGIVSDLRNAWMSPVSGVPSGELNMLSQIGINTGAYQDGGKLFIDEAKLKSALEQKPEEVMNLFTSGTDGIGDRLYDSVNKGIDQLGKKAGTPGTLIDSSFLTTRLKNLDEQMNTWEDKLATIESRYWKQFTAMETAMDKMNQQSMWVQQNLFGGM